MFAILARRAGHQVTVLEQRTPAESFGWGVVFWDGLLKALDSHDPQTAEAVFEKAPLLRHISAERIWAEMSRLLCGAGAERVLDSFAEVLFTVLPELEPMYGFDQRNPHHDYDVYIHTLKTVAACPPEPVLRWAALLHDSGKPHTFTHSQRDGNVLE
jgi:tRNA nucleotidyltransferase (CCA-adding enzyme)